MVYVLPKPLVKGDTIGIIAPSGIVSNKENIFRGKQYFEGLGYKVILSENLFVGDRYLSAPDEVRVSDVHWAFSNPEIDAIICARGGYGALRLIDKIDYELISSNPKSFCGYSDITVLSAMFLKRAGLITYSSPMVNGDFGIENRDEYTINSFFNALSGQKQLLSGGNIYKEGFAKGLIWGGNLSSVVSLCGVDFIPDEEFVFFAEDLNEPVYKIDKMFTQLLNIPKFSQNIRGIVLGDFLDVQYQNQLEYLFNQLADNLNIPVASGFVIGHDTRKDTIPYGKSCVLDGNKLFI